MNDKDTVYLLYAKTGKGDRNVVGAYDADHVMNIIRSTYHGEGRLYIEEVPFNKPPEYIQGIEYCLDVKIADLKGADFTDYRLITHKVAVQKSGLYIPKFKCRTKKIVTVHVFTTISIRPNEYEIRFKELKDFILKEADKYV